MRGLGRFAQALALAGLLVRPATSLALQQIISCDANQQGNTTTCTSNCILLTNIVCDYQTSGHNGITLSNGADLEMDGYDITFTGTPPANLKSAITLGANSIVKDTNTDPLRGSAVVSGPFNSASGAIRCTSATGTKVTDVRVSISSGDGIKGPCDTVQNAVVEGPSTATVGINAAKNIVDNYVLGFTHAVAPSANSIVDRNIIVSTSSTSNNISTPAGATFTNNMLIGPGTLVSTTGAIAAEKNYCDPNGANCTSCVSSGYCDTPVAPFVFP